MSEGVRWGDVLVVPQNAADALEFTARQVREAMSKHVASNGPPPGEYGQGVVDGVELALLIVDGCARNARRGENPYE